MRVQPHVAQLSITPLSGESSFTIIKQPKFETDEFRDQLQRIEKEVKNGGAGAAPGDALHNSGSITPLSFDAEPGEQTGEQTGEQEFFKFLFLSAMLNIP